MAVAKYASPSAQGSDIAGTSLNSLANNTPSAPVTFDNSTNRDLFASVEIALGSIASTAGAYIVLVLYSCTNGNAPDNTASVGGGDRYPIPITVGTSAKLVNVPKVALYPESMRVQVINASGATLASSGNTIKFRPYNEDIS